MKTPYFQCIGWYQSMAPEHRNSRTISDGAIFSTRALADEYARKNMADYHIKEGETDKPRIDLDHLIRSGSWFPSTNPIPNHENKE